MKILEELGLEANVKIDFDGDADIEVTGDVAVSNEANDKVTKVTVTFAVDVNVLEYTREDVLKELYGHAGRAAQAFGPYSNAVEAIDADIADVKAGGSLTPYAWLFENED